LIEAKLQKSQAGYPVLGKILLVVRKILEERRCDAVLLAARECTF
jgi:hypothetical protein